MKRGLIGTTAGLFLLLFSGNSNGIVHEEGIFFDEIVQVTSVIIDDYELFSIPHECPWDYSRIGTDRGAMGVGSYRVDIGAGSAEVEVFSNWAGLWTSLVHTNLEGDTDDTLDVSRLLGPYVRTFFQAGIVGIEIDLLNGSGLLKVELMDKDNVTVFVDYAEMSGGPTTLSFPVSLEVGTEIKRINWLVDGTGNATVDEVRFVTEAPVYTVPEAVFLFSYGHMCQCHDHDTGVVRDRARWPVENFAAVQTIGTFALASAIGWDLGYVEESDAEYLVQRAIDAILSLPRFHGLLPHFITYNETLGIWEIKPNTEWSSIDTVISLLSAILAAQALDIDTSPLEGMLSDIDWNDLTNNGTEPISMGYGYDQTQLASAWNTFGSEAFLMALAYSAATGNPPILEYVTPEDPCTMDGSGFNDEMAALLFPMIGIDAWGVDWAKFRETAADRQIGFFDGHLDFSYYFDLGLFGLSAGEIPEPWRVCGEGVYGAWGVGGCSTPPNDGSQIVGYPIIAPHYASLIMAERSEAAKNLFLYLIEYNKIFTPLNNVESFGIDQSGVLHWNSLKGAWNLSLQTLGASRAIYSDVDYLPYRMLPENEFLNNAFDLLMCDKDSDGFHDEACDGFDCDDTDPDVNPWADETCDNEVDDDCDSLIDLDDPDCGPTKLAFIRHKLNDNQYLNIYNAPPSVGGEINPLVASDPWIGNVGTDNEITHMTAGDIDGDGDEELVFIRHEVIENQYLHIYDEPEAIGGEINPLVASDKWIGKVGTDNEITHMAAGDIDGDGTDELIFIRRRPNGNQYLNIYYAPTVVGGEINPLVASDLWIGNIGTSTEITHMAAGDTDGDGDDELVFVRQRENDNQYLNIYHAPTVVNGEINPLIASDIWIGNVGTSNEITHMTMIR